MRGPPWGRTVAVREGSRRRSRFAFGRFCAEHICITTSPRVGELRVQRAMRVCFAMGRGGPDGVASFPAVRAARIRRPEPRASTARFC